MPVEIGVKQTWVVVERNEKFTRNKAIVEDDPGQPWRNSTYDTNSFQGSVTLAQHTEGGPSYYDTIDLDVSNRDDYEKFKQGAVVLAVFNFEEQS